MELHVLLLLLLLSSLFYWPTTTKPRASDTEELLWRVTQ